jgi:hypothetical protein
VSVESRVEAALLQGWDHFGNGQALSHELPHDVVEATEVVLAKGSAPNRQMLLAIVAGTADDGLSNPRALQAAAGIDRRSQAKVVSKVLLTFTAEKGYTLKFSKDPGVSNQWRSPELDHGWVEGRKAQDRPWARAFNTIVSWLAGLAEGPARSEGAQQLLEYLATRLVETSARNSFAYPKFSVTPSIAFALVKEFLRTTAQRPDALEAVVAAATRALAKQQDDLAVDRGDINSPDPIDVLVSSNGIPFHGIEVTDEPITLSKLKLEVLPAMQKFGLLRATVVSNGIKAAEAAEIGSWIESTYARFQQRIDIVSIDVIESWLTNPVAREGLVTDFVWLIGEELDAYSTDSNRRSWLEVLNGYVSAGDSAN